MRGGGGNKQTLRSVTFVPLLLLRTLRAIRSHFTWLNIVKRL